MARNHPDDELVGRLRLSVARLARLLRQQDASGMTPTTTATLATVAREGPLTLGELAAAEQVAPPTVTKAIAKLEAQGLIERISDPGDRRVCRVQLTDAGHRQIEANRSRRNAWLSDQLADLSPDERDRLAAAVDVLEHLTTARRREVGT
jgi:DNA-binding MarR family transcriptional regulator